MAARVSLPIVARTPTAPRARLAADENPCGTHQPAWSIIAILTRRVHLARLAGRERLERGGRSGRNGERVQENILRLALHHLSLDLLVPVTTRDLAISRDLETHLEAHLADKAQSVFIEARRCELSRSRRVCLRGWW